MNKHPQRPFDNGDEPVSNQSKNPFFGDIVAKRVQRRQVLQGGIAAAVASFFAAPAVSLLSRTANAQSGSKLLGFKAIPISDADTVVVPEGYTATTILEWGTPISGSYPEYKLDNTGEEQGMQVGSHHDGMHFYPIEGEDPYEGSSDEGLLVINHEYVEPRFMHVAAIGQEFDRGAYPVNEDGTRDPDEVLKEINAHGVSVVHIAKQEDGSWQVVRDNLNRRVTAGTPMEIHGPVRGSDFVRTKYSNDGTMTRGMLNQCAHGVTPWNTFLASEENWAGYFSNVDLEEGDESVPREHTRYGVRVGRPSRYGWELAANGADEYARFNVTPNGNSPLDDYRNEPNAFGYMVEFDPFDPDGNPKKRTALGRFAHEGAVFQPAVEGEPVVVYQGCDARFEYIYKYVSAQPFFKDTAGGHLLDNGTLYVAKFNDDGSGEWVALVFGQNGLTPENGFNSQADVIVNTRTSADFVGATKMDRPEWGAVDPNTNAVYFTLTNNTNREVGAEDASNPRPENRWGHIVRWNESSENFAGKTFEWDLFVLAGPTDDSETLSGEALDEDGMFINPDGLWVDAESRLWIQTDIGESNQNKDDFAQFGNNQMLAADPESGEIRRFLTGPTGQEITGVITTPDRRTMFINVQHPGATTSPEDFAAGKFNSRWPNNDDTIYPRSATVVITRDDGGIIGA
ncbi:MAG: PhoX family phosphatase [Cyanophyceae cyanobacterium]